MRVCLLPSCVLYREPHLAPMTYAPQAGVPQQHVQQAPPNSVGRLKLTVSQVCLCRYSECIGLDSYFLAGD